MEPDNVVAFNPCAIVSETVAGVTKEVIPIPPPEVVEDNPLAEGEIGSVTRIDVGGFEAKPTKEQQIRTKQLLESSRRNHISGKKIQYNNVDYVVTKNGAWVRLTERDVSRNTHNNSCRRRLEAGK